MFEILDLLKGADVPYDDQLTFVKAQMLFWLIAATAGHAKNFSVFLGPHGGFRLTPLCDVLSAEPSVRRRQIETKQVKLAMFVGDSRRYRIDEIEGRHFAQTVKRARLPQSLADEARSAIADSVRSALAAVENPAEELSGGNPRKHIKRHAAPPETDLTRPPGVVATGAHLCILTPPCLRPTRPQSRS